MELILIYEYTEKDSFITFRNVVQLQNKCGLKLLIRRIMNN